MKYILTIAICIQILVPSLHSQTYFNNLYNPENTWAQGRGILQIDNWYYGIFGTKLYANSNYKLTVFKMDLSGNIVDWNTIGEDWHHYWMGSLGGILIETTDGNLAFATHVSDSVYAHGVLIKLNLELDTLWKREYHSDADYPMTWKASQTQDGGYIMVGISYPGGIYYDGLLIKADSLGHEQWRQIYGVGTIYSEYLTNVIETPDGGYLIGGMRKETEYLDHTMDAMVMKTDSLGNEEWTNYYGNPDVDDDMAHLALADDGNFLVATTYGKNIIAPEARTAMPYLIKVDDDGNTVWEKSIGPHRLSLFMKNFRKESDDFILTGFSSETDTATFQYYSGWMMKLDNNLDSVWYRDYVHNLNDWDNMFYDASPASDNGYIAVGQARPDMGGNNKMWVVKVDSMGCDTPGCALGTLYPENLISAYDLSIVPNPSSKGKVRIVYGNTISQPESRLRCFNLIGDVVHEEKLYPFQGESVIDVSKLKQGIYLTVLYADRIPVARAKIVVLDQQ